jgi:hypothetical protein
MVEAVGAVTDEVRQIILELQQAQGRVHQLNESLFHHFRPRIIEKLRQRDRRGAVDLLKEVPQCPAYFRLWRLIQNAK